MKKMVLFTTTILIFGLTSCVKKTQNCHCDYVGWSGYPTAGQTKSEDTKVSDKYSVDAFGQCSDLEDKYFSAEFSGTCVLQ
ncbi:MAG: hypothetical protein JSS82_16320 [Bacteroidetes bacterium]|nr:hypothetical protein [Bacteroidota bacterium]